MSSTCSNEPSKQRTSLAGMREIRHRKKSKKFQGDGTGPTVAGREPHGEIEKEGRQPLRAKPGPWPTASKEKGT